MSLHQVELPLPGEMRLYQEYRIHCRYCDTGLILTHEHATSKLTAEFAAVTEAGWQRDERENWWLCPSHVPIEPEPIVDGG